VISRVYMLGVLLLAVWWYDKQRTLEALGRSPTPTSAVALAKAEPIRGHSLWHVDWHLEKTRLRRLLRLGLPAASQMGAEVGVFALATAMSGMLDPISSAAHQISLNLAGLSFMIPLGVGAAGAVRVGFWVGAREPARVAVSGWTAIVIGTGFMVASGLLFVVMPERLIGLFTTNADVLRVGTALLLLAALFQLFDGFQGVVTGTLRGLGDTRTAMIVNLGAHWLLGLPIGYTLCFLLGWGVYGLWVGLTLGLIVVAVILLWAWTRKIREYQQVA
jgi:MATE family multidrug resistance protein